MTTPSIKEALELKPCPFCGGTAEIADKRPKRRTYVTCTSCDTCTRIRDSAQEAAKHWNTRATLSPPAGERREAIAFKLFCHSNSPELWSNPSAILARDDAYALADIALASGLVQDEAGIRGSYVLVPSEPTQAMVTAGEEVCCASARDNCATIYRAMIAAIRSGLVQDEAVWQPIETAPKDTLKVTSGTLLLAHIEKKWVRFGKWYVQEGCWYYSGTNERSQYAQVRGDDPTHWMPLPAPPIRSGRDGGAET